MRQHQKPFQRSRQVRLPLSCLRQLTDVVELVTIQLGEQDRLRVEAEKHVVNKLT